MAKTKGMVSSSSLITNYKLKIKKEEGESEESIDLNDLLTASPETLLPEDFISRKDELRLMPLYELLEELFSIFNMGNIEKQDAYLFSFFDAVTEYLQSNSANDEKKNHNHQLLPHGLENLNGKCQNARHTL